MTYALCGLIWGLIGTTLGAMQSQLDNPKYSRSFHSFSSPHLYLHFLSPAKVPRPFVHAGLFCVHVLRRLPESSPALHPGRNLSPEPWMNVVHYLSYSLNSLMGVI